jgi:ribosomal protein S18 acetylase RimI-like enzyme
VAIIDHIDKANPMDHSVEDHGGNTGDTIMDGSRGCSMTLSGGKPLKKLTPAAVAQVKVWRTQAARLNWSEITRQLRGVYGIRIKRNNLIITCRRVGRIGENKRGYIYDAWCAPERGWGGWNKRGRKAKKLAKVLEGSDIVPEGTSEHTSAPTSKHVDKLTSDGPGNGAEKGRESGVITDQVSVPVIPSLTVTADEPRVPLPEPIIPTVLVIPLPTIPAVPTAHISNPVRTGIPAYSPSAAVGPKPVFGAGGVPGETADERRERIIRQSREARLRQAEEAKRTKEAEEAVAAYPVSVLDEGEELGRQAFQQTQMAHPLAHLHAKKIKLRAMELGDVALVSQLHDLWVPKPDVHLPIPSNSSQPYQPTGAQIIKGFFLGAMSSGQLAGILNSPGKSGWIATSTDRDGVSNPHLAGFLIASTTEGLIGQDTAWDRESLVWRDSAITGGITVEILQNPLLRHIQFVGTHPNFLRQGVARKLVEELGKTNAGGPISSFVAMRPWENRACLAVHKKLGFRVVADSRAAQFQGLRNHAGVLMILDQK